MVQEILIVRFSSLGDLILTTPFFREAKRLYPKARITLVTASSFAGAMQNNPHIHRLIALDRKEGKEGFQRLVAELGKTDWDLAFDLHQSLRSRLLMQRLFGFFYKSHEKVFCIDKRSAKRNLLLLFKINLFHGFPSQREAYLQPLKDQSGQADLDAATELFPNEEEQERVDSILHQSGANGKPLIALGPSASFEGKCWPKERFLELGLKLHERGASVVILGGPGDEEPAWMMQNGGEGKFLDLAGKLSYLETAALLKRARLAVSNDSAIVHFAEAMQTPALALFGPTVAEFGYGPFLEGSLLVERDLECRPCSRNGKGKCRNKVQRRCLVEIEVKEVFSAVQERLGPV